MLPAAVEPGQELRLFWILRVALENRLAEQTLDHGAPSAHALKKIRPQAPLRVPRGEQHRRALRPRNVPPHQLTSCIKAEMVARLFLEHAMRHERPHEASQCGGVGSDRGRQFRARKWPGREKVRYVKLSERA